MRFEDALDRQEGSADRGEGWRVAWNVGAPLLSPVRPLRSLPGMLLFQDATHRWIGSLDRDFALAVTLDDATGVIYSALLVATRPPLTSTSANGAAFSSGVHFRRRVMISALTMPPSGTLQREAPPIQQHH